MAGDEDLGFVGAPAFRPVKLRQKEAGFSPGAVPSKILQTSFIALPAEPLFRNDSRFPKNWTFSAPSKASTYLRSNPCGIAATVK